MGGEKALLTFFLLFKSALIGISGNETARFVMKRGWRVTTQVTFPIYRTSSFRLAFFEKVGYTNK
ncbi:MAG: hypothetical protein IJX39_09200 [Clostridia bacterium]|nr:hypothetical protein [Clostridia bacterium]